MSRQQAKIFLASAVLLAAAAVTMAVLAVTYASQYGIRAALASGLSVGAGISFSNGLLYVTEKGKVAKLVGLCMLLAVSILLGIILLPVTTHVVGGIQQFDLMGSILGILLEFSFAALVFSAFLSLSDRMRSRAGAGRAGM